MFLVCCVLFSLFLINMNQNHPYFVNKGKEKNGKNIENSYVLYTPKIVKFSYESNECLKNKMKKIQ